MSDLIKLYNGTVTPATTDGNEVTEGSLSNPVQFTLNAAKNEENCQKLAIRCKSGYRTYGDTTITAYHYNKETTAYEATGGDVEKWMFAPDNGYANADEAKSKAKWAKTLTISDVITDKNTVFWAKASSSAAEVPQNDTDESIHVEAVIEAV